MDNETNNLEYKPEKSTKFTGFLLAGSKFIAGFVFLGIYFFNPEIMFLVVAIVMFLGGFGFLIILKKFNKIINTIVEKENNSKKV